MNKTLIILIEESNILCFIVIYRQIFNTGCPATQDMILFYLFWRPQPTSVISRMSYGTPCIVLFWNFHCILEIFRKGRYLRKVCSRPTQFTVLRDRLNYSSCFVLYKDFYEQIIFQKVQYFINELLNILYSSTVWLRARPHSCCVQSVLLTLQKVNKISLIILLSIPNRCVLYLKG